LTQFGVLNFWAVVIQSRPFQPISTTLIKLVQALINSEPEPDPLHQERIKWIYANTHEKVNVPLSIIELAVFRNLDRNLNKELDIGDKCFNLTELYKYLDEVTMELSEIVIEIAKKYNIDMPMANFSQGKAQQNIGFE
jgi:hypothetical protein